MSSSDTEAAPAVATDERREALLAELAAYLGDDLLDSHIDPGRELWIRVPISAWRSTFRHLRDDHGFHFFEFVSAIDWKPSPYGRYEDAAIDEVDEPAPEATVPPADGWETGVAGGETRFQVFARVRDVLRGDLAVVVKADVPPAGDDPDEPGSVESIASLYAGADWQEREMYEMFGIGVDGHRYLEALYLPSGFEGHPLRKDYPLVARIVKPWPGIVDVEPMPDEGDDDEAEEETA